MITACYANNPVKPGKPIFQEFKTPIGNVVHCYVDKPQLQQTDSQPPKPVLDENGIQKADFKITLAWPKAYKDVELIPMRTLGAQVVREAWGDQAMADAWLNLQPFLRDGNNPEHNTKRKEYLFDMVYMNFKSTATPTRHPDGRVTYSGAPQVIGPYNEDLLPVDMYAGCEARISGIMFGTEYSGKRFISTRLNNVQKNIELPGKPFERMGGGGRPDAKKQFDPLASGPAPGSIGFTGGTIVL